MEWVEVTGRTVDDAKERALDQLGVAEDEAEFEILEEPKPGLFGRLRSEARVRARVAPAVPRPKVDRRDRRRQRRPRGSGTDGPEGPAPEPGAAEPQTSRMAAQSTGGDQVADKDLAEGDADEVDEVEVAEEFLAGLLETFGVRFSIDRRELEGDLVELSVQGEDLGLLIGARGQTLSAVQELTRTVVQRQSGGRPGRIIVDIAGYREARRQALERFARQVADEVRSSGVARVLEPMPPPDRKVVHDAINPLPGVTTTSEGEEPGRRVVISATDPADRADPAAATAAD